MKMQVTLRNLFFAGLVTSLLYGSAYPIRFPAHEKLPNGERLDRLKHTCKKMNLQWSDRTAYEKKYALQHILVNDKHNILYCYVPKVACSNWKRVITVLNGEANDTDAIEQVDHKSFKTLASYSPSEVQHKLKNYYKFMFVREPLRRLVSAYKDKLTGDNEYYKKVAVEPIIQRFRNKNKRGPPKGVTLEEFFLSLQAAPLLSMDEHWIPMYKLCQPCVVSYDFIGTMENIDAESKEVLDDMNVKDKVKFPRKQKMYTTRRGPSTEELLSEIPQNLVKTILYKYNKDYELFSYELPVV